MINKILLVIRYLLNVKLGRPKTNLNIAIFGFSRGGTTMLGEALSKSMDGRLAWEPLFPHRNIKMPNPFSTRNLEKLELGWSPFIAKDNHSEEVRAYFRSLFNLKERNIRLFRFTDFSRFSKQDKTIWKFCFGDFMYPYLDANFKLKSIVLLRHPFAIACSSMNFGENYDWHKTNFNNWKYTSNKWSEGDKVFEDVNANLELINSPIALLIYQSVSHFSFALNNLNSKTSKVVFYEDLVVNSKQTIQELKSFFDDEFDEHIFEKFINKPRF